MESTALFAVTLHALALEIVADSVIIQNMTVLGGQDDEMLFQILRKDQCH